MSLDWLKSSEQIPTAEKEDFSAINTDHILKQSEIIAKIKDEEYTENVDNKTTIPADLEWFFPEEDVIVEWKEFKTEKLKKELYSKLWLSEILEENSGIQKFEKWLLDWWLLDNLKMLESLANSSVEEILKIMKQLSNWETIKAILIDLYDWVEDITKVFSDPYVWWVALWSLWIWPISKSLKTIKLAEKFWKIKEKNLFDSKKYDLKSDEKLDELLKRLDENDIIWEWENAIIINHPDNDKLVIKIAKEWMYVDDIIKERNAHQLFLDTYREWLVKWKIDKNVKIPEIFSPENLNSWYFYIEKIEWQNLFTKYHLDLYKDKELSKYNLLDLENLTDSQFLKILKEEKLSYAIPSMNLWDVGMWWWWSTLQVNMMLYTNKFQKENMKKTIEYFEQNWLIHTDFHAWNIMIDKNKKNFIIDFGNTNR